MARILVLEDDANLRRTLTGVLEEEDHEVFGVGSGPEAIAAAQRTAFDLVISDIRMEGMDGLQCLAALREVRPELRSIVITGYASEEAPARAMAVRAEDYLYKPFQLKDLLRSVDRVLSSAKEREGHHKILSAVISGFRKLLSGGGKPAQDLEEQRNLVFQSLYVGIRSGKLKPLEALQAWGRLEKLEGQREVLKGGTPAPDTMQELLVGYRYVVDMLAALAAQKLRAEVRPEDPLFQKLFLRVKQGDVSCEELKLAPYLRTLEPEVLQGSPMLAELHARVW